MKNIIWKMGNGKLAVTSILDASLNSEEFAKTMKANGDIPGDFTPVLFDVQEFPPGDVDYWRYDATAGLTGDTAAALAGEKARKWDAIKAERDRRKAGGAKVGAKWFHSDDGSRIQQMGLVMMGANIPANLQWKTMDGSFVTMTQQLAGQVLAAAAASDQAIFAAAEAHRQAMEASADPAAYDFSTGWPKVFGE